MKKMWMLIFLMQMMDGVFADSSKDKSLSEVVDGIEWIVEDYTDDAVEVRDWRPVDVTKSKDSFCSIVVPKRLLGRTVDCLESDIFAGCKNLELVSLPESICKIDSRAFKGCSKLKHVNIPQRVWLIDYSAFEDCPMLGDGLVIVDNWVLTVNGSCPQNLVIPEGVRGIAARVFEGIEAIRSVRIPDSMTYICSRAFADCKGLGEGLICADGWVLAWNGEGKDPVHLSIPKGTKGIACGRNMWCNLKTLEIPDGVISIGHEAFKYSRTLESVNFPEGLKWIGAEAFQDCSIREIIFPSNTVTLGYEAFQYNTGLKSVTFLGNPPNATEGGSIGNVFLCDHEVIGYYSASSASWKKLVFTGECETWGLTMVPYGQTPGTDPEPEPEEAFKTAHTFNGLVTDKFGMYGMIQVTTKKKSAKGDVKVNGIVMMADGKRQTLKVVSGKVSGGAVSVTTKVAKIGELSLTITDDGFTGTLGDMTVASEDIGEETGIISGTLKMSYFDKTGKMIKTKSYKLTGVTSNGEAVGNVSLKNDVKTFEAVIE